MLRAASFLPLRVGPRYRPVGDLRREYSEHDGHLVEAHETSAYAGRSDFRYVHRGDGRCNAYAHASGEPGDAEPAELVEGSCRDSAYGKQHRGSYQQGLPAVAVGERARHHRAYHAAHERGTGRHSLKHGVSAYAEELFIELDRPSYHDPVIAE